MQTNEVRILSLKEAGDLSILFVNAEDVEGDDFEAGAGADGCVFLKGEIVLAKRNELENEADGDSQRRFERFGGQ